MIYLFVTALLAFIVTVMGTPMLIKAAKAKGIVGRDIHKKGTPEVAELGGLAIAAGIVVALLFAIGINSFATLRTIFGIQESDGTNIVVSLLAALSGILMIELIGFVDDILGVRHAIKFLLPMAAALPLMAVKITAISILMIPIIGELPIPPIIYVVILIPIGFTAATNVTNTFAGYNGLEAGMGAVVAAILFVLGWHLGLPIVMILGAALLGALVAFLAFNWYPAKIFPDDVGTLLIGCMIATTVILGRIEFAGVVLLLPYIIDFLFFKIPNRLPSKGWWGTLKGEKLYHEGKPVQFGQWIMKVTGGITEKNLVLLLIGMEVLLGVIVLGLYW